MSKKLFSKVFILLLVVGLLFAATPTKQAQAATLDVCPTCTYTTIQAAVAASAAGDVINVAAGTYDIGTLVIPHPLSIIGAGDTTLVNGKFQLTNADSVAGTYLFQTMKFPVTNSSITVTDFGHVIDEVKVDYVTFDTNLDNSSRAIGVGVDSVDYQIKKFTVLNSRFYSTLAIYLDGDIGEMLIQGNQFHVTDTHWGAYNAINFNQSKPASGSVNPSGVYTIQNNQVFVPGDTYSYAGAITNMAYPGSVLAGQPGGKELTASGNTITVGAGAASTDQSLFVKDLIANTNDPFPVHNLTKDTWFTTIQAALNAAVADDVIEVGPGTYPEHLVINTPVTLQGAPNWEAKIVGDIGIKASYVTLQGLDISHPGSVTGINFSNDQATPRLTLHHISILNNKIHDMGGVDGGNVKAIKGSHGPDDVLIEGNEIYDIRNIGDRGTDAIYFGDSTATDPSTGIVIRNNTFRNITAVGRQTNAIGFSNESGGVAAVIEGNTFEIDTISTQNTSNWYRAYVIGLEGKVPGIIIRGNTFQATNPANISSRTDVINFAGGTSSSAIVFEKNKFLVDRRMVVGTSVNASINWWGQATGPTTAQKLGLSRFIQWCTNPECTEFSQASLSLSPATINAATCGQQYVDVVVANVADLTAYTMEVTFDQTKVRIDSVENRGLFTETTAHSVVSVLSDLGNTTGRLIFGAYLQDKSPDGNPGPVTSPSGTLMRIYYTPLLGTTTFTVQAESLLIGWPEANPMPFSVSGAATATLTGGVVRNTDTSTNYCSLATAVADAGAGHNLQVLSDITLTETITIDKALTLDTNLKTISRTVELPSNNSFVVVPGGDLTITGGGTITTSTGNAIRIQGNETIQAKVTLASGTLYGPNASVVIIGNRSFTDHTPAFKSLFVMTGGSTNETILVLGNGAEADIKGGTLTGWAPIMGNGTVDQATNKNEGGTKITISGTAQITGTDVAIFHPQDGLLTINGGTIIGTNGIEMDAGDLVITGGTIQATGTCLAAPAVTPEDGSTDTGDAILIMHQPGYTAGDLMHVTISGNPTIISNNCYALRELDFGGASSDLALATITGGHFTGGTPGAVYFATNTEAVMELVGGDYSADPLAYVYTPYSTYQFGSRWYITKSPTITSNVDQGYYLAGEEKAFDVTMNLPAGGIDLALMIFDYKLAGVTTTDITKFEFFAQDLNEWIELGSRAYETYANCADNTGICGQFGWAPGGFGPIAAGFTNTTQFRVTFAKGFVAPLTFTLDLSGKLVETDNWTKLTTYTGSLNVYDKPTLTISQDPYFIAGEAGKFNVQIQNPLTGVPYGDSVVFYLKWVGLDLTDIAVLQDGTTLLDCYVGTQHWLYKAADFVDTTEGLELRLDGADDYFTVTPGFDHTVTCSVTYNKTGAITFTDQMVHVTNKTTVPVTERPVSALESATANVYTKPTILPTFPTSPIFAGVPVIVPVVITNPEQLTDPFELVLTVPAGTVVKIGATTYPCTGTTCIIPVDLTGTDVYPATLNIEFTFPAAGTPDIGFALYDRAWMGTEDRLLATYTQADLPVGGGFTVTGNFSMQGNLSRAGVPVTFTWTGDLVPYGPTGYSTAVNGTNFSQVLTYGGNYTINTLQPRYLNVYADLSFSKIITVTGDRLLPELRLKGGNAYWRVVVDNVYTDQYDNSIGLLDANRVGTDWGGSGSADLTINHGDVNFDGKVNIQDLALVGGNFGLTSAVAYGTTWVP